MTYYRNTQLRLGRMYLQIRNIRAKTRANLALLKVIYHHLYSMNKFGTNKSKLPQDGAQVFPYMG